MPFAGARGALLTAAVFAAGCNNAPVTLTSGTPAVITIAVSPDPVIANKSANVLFDYDIQWRVLLTESAGVAGTVNFIQANLYDPTTGSPQGNILFDSSDLLVLVGSNKIAANGTFTITQNMSFRLPARGNNALLSIIAQIKDNNGNLISSSILVQVQ